MLVLLCSCTTDTGFIPTEDVDSPFEGLVFDKKAPEEDQADASSEPFCKVLWTKTLDNAGGITHPAVGKHGAVVLTAGQKLYSLGDAGDLKWVWPDDDTLGALGPSGDLYTPVVGRESYLFMGTSNSTMISVDANGHGRYELETEGVVSGAPAIASDSDRVIILTDDGALYHWLDSKQHVKWSLSGEDKLANPMSGSQPVIAPAALYGEESILILTQDHVHAFELLEGTPLWSWPIPDGHTPSSNAIMFKDGTVLFVTGTQPMGEYFQESHIVSLPPTDREEGATVTLLYDNLTRATSLSQGMYEALLVGTDNAGLLNFDHAAGQLRWQFFPPDQNFETVAQPVQGKDGFIYFGAARHWLQVASQYGDSLWLQKLDDEAMGAILWPASPIILEDGTAILKTGNYVYALNCSDAGPADLGWPRFGGNNRNSGNIAAKLEQPE